MFDVRGGDERGSVGRLHSRPTGWPFLNPEQKKLTSSEMQTLRPIPFSYNINIELFLFPPSSHLPFFPSAKDSAMESVTAERTLSAMTLVTPVFFTTWSNNSVFFRDC